jgi:uncharacterized protein (DUF58 family)
MKSRFKYLKPEDIRKLSSFEFAPKALVDGYLAGRHKSNAAGSSIEFRDFRQYVQGDDPAMIDWRVYARTDRYYLRTYEQETNMECHVFLDSSASMGFGKDISKLDYSSFFAAALCYLVVRSSDRVSLQIFDDKTRSFFPPGSTGTHLQNLMHALESNYPGNRTSIAQALKKSFPLLKRKGTLIVISDFFDDPASVFSALSPYLHRGIKVHLIHVLAPEEMDLDDRGLVTFDDLETGTKVVAHTDNIRKLYKQAIHEHITRIRQLAVRRNVEYMLARTDTHYFKLFDKLAK